MNTKHWKRLPLVMGILLVGLLAVLLTGCGENTPTPSATASVQSEPPPQELRPKAFFSRELRAADFWINLYAENTPSGVSVHDALSTGDPLEALEYTLSVLQEANNRWTAELSSGKFRGVYTIEQLQTIDDATRRMAGAAKALWDSYAKQSWSSNVEQIAITDLRWARLELEMIDIASESRSLAGQVKMHRLPTPVPQVELQARGREEARRTEFQNISAAITALMVENKISSIPNPSANIAPCTTGTKEMNSFPDSTSIDTDGADPGTDLDKAKDPVTGTAYDFLAPGVDKAGYLLYTHDITADALLTPTINYVNFNKSTYCYKADRDGTVHQYNEAGVEQTQ